MRTLLVAGAVVASVLCVPAHAASGPTPLPPAMGIPGGLVSLGRPAPLGAGTVRNYVVSRGATPVSIGVVLSPGALDGLPMHPPTDGTHCVDVDGDGVIDEHDYTECVGGYETRLPWPSSSVNAPYQFTMVNWNPMGHSGMLYPKPHFDVHFYLDSPAQTDAISMGTCAELVACDLLPTALKELPAAYQPLGYVSPPGAVEGQMGAHMVDPASPTGEQFTRTFIYGKYDARLTFLEPMVTVEHLLAVKAQATGRTPAQVCDPVPQPTAWQRSGWYPTTSCVRYSPTTGQFTISLDGLHHS